MNEYQRQAYLSVLGVENYMPRWRLALAPEPVVCVLPIFSRKIEECDSFSGKPNTLVDIPKDSLDVHRQVIEKPIPVAEVLRGLSLEKKSDVGNVTVVAPVPEIEQLSIPAFALSIWRPQADLLIIDSRNTSLALPTEMLLSNILLTLFGIKSSLGKEDVLRWPMVENAFVARTFDDAKGALQVWLEVELEQRPAEKILLMGKNAAQYFLPNETDYTSCLWKPTMLTVCSSTAVIVPSLIELLQQPLMKRDLWRLLQSWCGPV